MLVEDRLEGLPAETLGVLEVVSALSTPTLDAIAAGTDTSEIDRRMEPTFENAVVELINDRVRFTHPLLASEPSAAELLNPPGDRGRSSAAI